MTQLSMPKFLKSWVDGKPAPVILTAVVIAIFGLNWTGEFSAAETWASLFVFALIAMLLREWSLAEGRRQATAVETEGRRQASAVEKQYRRLVTGLDRATSNHHAEYEESIEQTWFVEADGSDKGTIRYETSVLGSDSMAWRRVKLFPTVGGQVPSVDEMGFTCAESPGGSAEAFRVKDGGAVDYVVIFGSPIVSAASRSWTVEYNWPGLWDPLRDSGDDQGIIELTKPAPHVSMRIVFPVGAQIPGQAFLRRQPNVGTERFETFNGRPSLVWEIGPGQAGQVFRADVRAVASSLKR